jgi:N-acetylmuramoyl-L-alanine amidase
VSLEQRTDVANSLITETEDAVIFISIHANASLNKKARGYEVWYLPDEYRRELISPDSLTRDSRELAPILNSMREEEYTRESVFLAQSIVDHFERRVGDRSVNRGIREESWFVVRNAKMPAVLVELGFLTNDEEAALLAETGYLRTLAEAIYSAVAGFVIRFEGGGLAPEEVVPTDVAAGVAAVAGN